MSISTTMGILHMMTAKLLTLDETWFTFFVEKRIFCCILVEFLGMQTFPNRRTVAGDITKPFIVNHSVRRFKQIIAVNDAMASTNDTAEAVGYYASSM